MQSKEIQYGEKLSELSKSLTNSVVIVSDLVQQGYKAYDLEALDKFVVGLTNAMKGLTKLIHDQAIMLETEKVIRG